MFSTADSSGPDPYRVAIVGGGITGLAAAHRLLEKCPSLQITLFECSSRLGGVLETRRQAGYLIEQSADAFVTNNPPAVNLCKRLGIADQLLPTNEAMRRASVVRNGKLHRLPEGFVLMVPRQLGSVLKTPILSPLGKLRLFCEPFMSRQRFDRGAEVPDISVAEFARHRLGREAHERLVQPLLAGIYTGDSERLSMAATMPQFLEQVAEHGSLVRAYASQIKDKQSKRARSGQEEPDQSEESGARYGMFVAPRDGMSGLIEALVQKLPADTVQLNAQVSKISLSDEGKWSVSLSGAGATNDNSSNQFEGLILATPSTVAAKLIGGRDAELAAQLRGIPYASSVVLCLGCHREQVSQGLDGFGFVVPALEKRKLIAASFSSVKFPGRAPKDQVLIRVFMGGATQPEMNDLDDPELRSIALEELRDLIGLRGEPIFTNIVRWPNQMPQYHVGHLDRVGKIEQLVGSHAGLELAGAAYRGVGIPQCIASGEQAAERLVATLNPT